MQSIFSQHESQKNIFIHDILIYKSKIETKTKEDLLLTQTVVDAYILECVKKMGFIEMGMFLEYEPSVIESIITAIDCRQNILNEIRKRANQEYANKKSANPEGAIPESRNQQSANQESAIPVYSRQGENQNFVEKKNCVVSGGRRRRTRRRRKHRRQKRSFRH